jgi:urease accessory protein UreF
MTNYQAGQMVVAALRATPVEQTAIRQAIYAALEKCFGEQAEQILWRAAESLERTFSADEISSFGECTLEPELHEENGRKWEADVDRAHSCRRL